MRSMLLLVLLAACRDGEHCKGWVGSNGRATFFQCGDGKERVVECTMQKCTCTIDGVATTSFEAQDVGALDTRDGAIAFANAKCGWASTK